MAKAQKFSASYRFEPDGEVVVKVMGTEYRPSDILNISKDFDDVEEQMTENPEYFVIWSAFAAECEAQERELKENISYIDSMLSDIIRDEWNKNNTTRCTDTWVQSQITQHETHTNAVTAHTKAAAASNIIKSVVRAFEQRHHLLLSLNSNRREENKQSRY